jgi:hypothetical protein
MKCAVRTEDLQGFVDGELGPTARERVARHLAGCATCRTAAAELKELSRELSALEFGPAPEGIAEAAMGRIAVMGRRSAQPARPGLTWRRVWSYAGAAAAAVAAIMITVDRIEVGETGRSMLSTLAADAEKQHERKAAVKALLKAFDKDEPLATIVRPGFTVIVFDARVAKDGDVCMLTNFSFAGGSCPDVRDEYGNLYVPISMGEWDGPNELVWLTPLRPSETVTRPRELTLAFASRDIAYLRARTDLQPVSIQTTTIALKDPKRGLDPGALLTRMMANAGLDAASQREFARQLRIIAPNGADALNDSF